MYAHLREIFCKSIQNLFTGKLIICGHEILANCFQRIFRNFQFEVCVNVEEFSSRNNSFKQFVYNLVLVYVLCLKSGEMYFVSVNRDLGKPQSTKHHKMKQNSLSKVNLVFTKNLQQHFICGFLLFVFALVLLVSPMYTKGHKSFMFTS